MPPIPRGGVLDAEQATGPSSTEALDRRGRALVVAVFLGTLMLFLPTVLSYHSFWTMEPNTHGYVVLLGVLWLLWQERGTLRVAAGWPAPLAVITALSLVWMLGQIAGVQAVGQIALPLVALAWTAAVFGPPAYRRLAPIAAVFLIAVPIWSALTPVLRGLTVAVSSAVLRLIRVPATIDGSLIHLTHGSFSIEDECAGLSFFLAGAAIGGLYAVRFARGTRTRVKVLTLAVFLSIAANWLRVTSLIVIGHVSEMRAAIIHSHHTYGWLTFLLFVLLVFFPLAGLIVRREHGASASPRGQTTRGADRGDEPLSGGAFRGRAAARASAVAAVGPLLLWTIGALPSREPTPPALPDGLVGAFVRGGAGTRAHDWSPAYHNPSRIRSTGWSAGAVQGTLDHLVYRGQTQGAELIGYPNRIAPDSLLATERMVGPVGPERRIVNEVIVREGAGHVLVWYWYRVGGIETASPLKAKLLEIPAFFRRVDSSELIALSTVCAPGSCEAGARALAAILGEGT